MSEVATNLAGAEAQTGGREATDRAPSLTKVRLWLVDDDPSVRELLPGLLEKQGGIKCEGEFASITAVLSALERGRSPQVVLLDAHLADGNGLEAIEPIQRLAPGAEVLILTTFYDLTQEAQARAAGACGFLLKSDPLPEIARCVRAAGGHTADSGSTICSGGTIRGFRRRGTAHVRLPLPTVPQEKEPAPTAFCSRSRAERVMGLFRALLGGSGLDVAS